MGAGAGVGAGAWRLVSGVRCLFWCCCRRVDRHRCKCVVCQYNRFGVSYGTSMIGIEIGTNILLRSVKLLVYRSLELPSRFTGPNALVPRVLNLCVASISAGSEPRAPATTTTHFAGFTDGDTCGANGIDGVRRGS